MELGAPVRLSTDHGAQAPEFNRALREALLRTTGGSRHLTTYECVMLSNSHRDTDQIATFLLRPADSPSDPNSRITAPTTRRFLDDEPNTLPSRAYFSQRPAPFLFTPYVSPMC